MRILLTGSTGYIGRRLLPILLEQGHNVVCCVRNKKRFPEGGHYAHPNIQLHEVDFLNDSASLKEVGKIDAAYYLIHSMSSSEGDFSDLEAKAARNFVKWSSDIQPKQVIYLGGIANDKTLSKHLSSRKNVEAILKEGDFSLTALRAGIIVGSGSASFEIIRDLVEKLPVMVAPSWLNVKTQPLAVRNVLEFLSKVLLFEESFDKTYDIGGPNVLSYKEMLMQFAKVRRLRRWIYTVPVMTPKLSSYWLYFVTSTSYRLAVNLVDSMKVEVIAEQNDLAEKLGIELLTYEDAVRLAFQKIDQNSVVSSWKDAFVASGASQSILYQVDVPKYGCYVDERKVTLKVPAEKVIQKIWRLGGETGWYHANWLWGFRGFVDKVFGGVGLRRGRTNKDAIFVGDTLDFWRVLLADFEKQRLLLYAEMKLPGEAWLEFKLQNEGDQTVLVQTATFRPKGLLGRLYWYSVLPFHGYIFSGMIKKIAKG